MLPAPACPRELKRIVVGRTRTESTGSSVPGPIWRRAITEPSLERSSNSRAWDRSPTVSRREIAMARPRFRTRVTAFDASCRAAASRNLRRPLHPIAEMVEKISRTINSSISVVPARGTHPSRFMGSVEQLSNRWMQSSVQRPVNRAEWPHVLQRLAPIAGPWTRQRGCGSGPRSSSADAWFPCRSVRCTRRSFRSRSAEYRR